MPEEISLKEYVEKMEKNFDRRLTDMEKSVTELKVKIAWFSGLGSAIGIVIGQIISFFLKSI